MELHQSHLPLLQLTKISNSGPLNCHPRDIFAEGAAAPQHRLPQGRSHAGGQALPHL